jgi:hypothetical protein
MPNLRLHLTAGRRAKFKIGCRFEVFLFIKALLEISRRK